jgi:hypothetical protein
MQTQPSAWLFAALLATASSAQAQDLLTPAQAADMVMNWAEWKFPDVFPGHAADQQVAGYTARAYAGDNYLGVANDHAYVYLSSEASLGIQDVGLVSDYAAMAAADGFPTLAQRTAAAQQAATSNADCTAVAPFYWEVGDAGQAQASGSVGGSYTADSVMAIASASKWLYGAYVAERRAGALTATDIHYLTFQSGYTQFTDCAKNDSVHSCATSGSNGVFNASTANKFYYGGGHMQQHADQVMGLGALTNVAFGTEIKSTLGLSTGLLQFFYSQPQPAGGADTTPAIYGQFLRKVLAGGLKMHDLLGANAVCTNPTVCPAAAVSTPFPLNETPQYSIGHWVEDTVNSDGAYSSAGAFGFYPWIDAGKHWYGLVARVSMSGITSTDSFEKPAVQSVYCGRRIRTAWLTGAAP